MAENSLWAREINGDDDEDEALRIAIAMSLGEEVPGKKQASNESQAIDLTQEDDIETASEPSNPASPVPHTRPTENKQPVAQPTAPTSGLAMLGLDRKKMEEERLARLGKRKAPDGNAHDDLARPSQRLKTDSAPAAQLSRTPGGAYPATKAGPSATRPSDGKETESKLPFPQGVVKKTWCAGQPRLGDDIKVEEVLQKDELELAVISSFQWDPDFLISKIDLSKTRICLIAYAPEEAEVGSLLSTLNPAGS
jgi:hypothetical protein